MTARLVSRARKIGDAKSDTLKPGVALLAKLGSIAGHVDEFTGIGGHQFDWEATKALIADPEIQEWLGEMRALAFVPEPRIKKKKP